jgi:hypothetical protein
MSEFKFNYFNLDIDKDNDLDDIIYEIKKAFKKELRKYKHGHRTVEILEDIHYRFDRLIHRSKLNDFYWYLQHRFNPRHQYHKINTGFKPGYYDPSISVPAALFETTSHFIEKSGICWDYDPGHIAAGKAFKDARDWWRNGGREKLFDYPDAEDEERFRKERDGHLLNILTYIDYMWWP